MVLRDNPKAYAIMGCAMRVHATLVCGKAADKTTLKS